MKCPIPILALLCVVLASSCSKDDISDAQKDRFVKYFGGSDFDVANDVVQTDDGGYVFVGTMANSGNKDIGLVKTDGFGNLLWKKTFGESNDDFGNCIQSLNDGYIILGTYTDTNNFKDMYLIRTDLNGVEKWSKKIGGAFNQIGNHVEQTNDGGFILGGSTDSNSDPAIQHTIEGVSDIFYLKTNSSGDSLWSRAYPKVDKNAWVSVVKQKTNGAYVIIGSTEDATGTNSSEQSGSYNIALVETNPDNGGSQDPGVPEYRTIGGAFNDYGEDIEILPAGYMLLGTTFEKGNADINIIRLETVWSNPMAIDVNIGGNLDDYASSIAPAGEDYIIAGKTNSYGNGSDDFYLVKIDVEGDTLWTKTFGGIGVDAGTTALQTSEGGYIIAGSTDFENNTMATLIKTNENGGLTPID